MAIKLMAVAKVEYFFETAIRSGNVLIKSHLTITLDGFMITK